MRRLVHAAAAVPRVRTPALSESQLIFELILVEGGRPRPQLDPPFRQRQCDGLARVKNGKQG